LPNLLSVQFRNSQNNPLDCYKTDKKNGSSKIADFKITITLLIHKLPEMSRNIAHPDESGRSPRQIKFLDFVAFRSVFEILIRS